VKPLLSGCVQKAGHTHCSTLHTPPSLLSLVYFDCVYTLAEQELDALRRPVRYHFVSEVHVSIPDTTTRRQHTP
jgi:hypothetical protein